MDNENSQTNMWLRQTGLVALFAIGILSTLATGGGGGGGGTFASAGTIQLASTSFDASEGTIVNIRVARSGGTSGVVSVDYATADGSAVAGSDYTEASGTLTWQDGVGGNQTISIPITDDVAAEVTETFTLTLSNVSRATLGSNSSATVSIVDNDVTSLSALGPITALDSVTINGIRYSTSAANVVINGVPGNLTDLKLGQVVSVEGEANLSEAIGNAEVLRHSAMIIGPVENIDPAQKQLIVMGQTVTANTDTVFDPLIDPDTFAGLAVGSTAQISGFRNADGEVVATRIEADTLSAGMQLVGTVAGLDLANLLFTIGRLTVDYGTATVIDLPMGMPTDGLLVVIRGSLIDGILVVDEIADGASVAAEPGQRVHLTGVVTHFTSPDDFDLNGFSVTTDSGTRFVNGSSAEIQVNSKVTVDGEVAPGGGIVLATYVSLGQPNAPRITRLIDFENFTMISLLGLCRVTVTEGPDYSIAVTASSDIVDDVQVIQNGDSVSFGPPPGDENALFTVVVTMPVLNRVDVGAGSLANVTLRDFNQAQMTVNVDGVSLLRGDSLAINGLTATVSGVSLLSFGGISPIGSASIEIDGVSQATLNMGVGSNLSGSVSTGAGTGESRLFYYGTGVILNVTTDAQSIVTQLGETRP